MARVVKFHRRGGIYMLWIVGSMAIIILLTVLMCSVIAGGREDRQMELLKLIEPSISFPFSAEYKIRIVLEGLRNETSVPDLCKREGISSVLYYSWLMDFIEAGKAHLREAVYVTPHRAESRERFRVEGAIFH